MHRTSSLSTPVELMAFLVPSAVVSKKAMRSMPSWPASSRSREGASVPSTIATGRYPPEGYRTERVRDADQIASEIPEEVDQYPCLCACYRDNEHESLLDCSRNEHAQRCGICMAEAEESERMDAAGRGESAIRRHLVDRYGRSR